MVIPFYFCLLFSCLQWHYKNRTLGKNAADDVIGKGQIKRRRNSIEQ